MLLANRAAYFYFARQSSVHNKPIRTIRNGADLWRLKLPFEKYKQYLSFGFQSNTLSKWNAAVQLHAQKSEQDQGF